MIETFVVYHKNKNIIDLKNIHPIFVGDYNLNYICDNTYDNISCKNSTYNELTAIYWVYKNYEKINSPDYVGFQHYRRLFYTKSFDNNYYEINSFEKLDKNDIIINENVENILKNYDFIVPCPIKVASVRQQFEYYHNNYDIDIVLDIIKKIYPNYYNTALNYINGNTCFVYNMFIFDKNTFFDYCNFIFSILNEYEKITPNKDRYFITERITGIYISMLIKKGKKPFYMPIIYIDNQKLPIIQAIKQASINKKNKLPLKQVFKPIAISLLPKSLWLKWKRSQLISKAN